MDLVSSLEIGNRGAQTAIPTTFGWKSNEAHSRSFLVHLLLQCSDDFRDFGKWRRLPEDHHTHTAVVYRRKGANGR